MDIVYPQRTKGSAIELVGQIAASLLGAAWGIVTFLVVPVMVAEDQNPFAAIGRSKDLLRQTWGAQIVGGLGIGVVLFLLALLGVVPIGLGWLSMSGPLLATGIAIGVIYWTLLAIVGTALSQIFRTAVYLYAASGSISAPFDSWMLQGAFKAKG